MNPIHTETNVFVFTIPPLQSLGSQDCLRHYEILLAGCIPYFLDIDPRPLKIVCLFIFGSLSKKSGK